jgi:GT2 family glycosyltransferase
VDSVTVRAGRGESGIAVIVPSFNAGGYLLECLASVVSQTVAPHEIILVDDGSTDGSIDHALAALPATARAAIRVIRQPNRGISAARNAGAQAAKSTWLALLDADDLMANDQLESLHAAATAHPDAVMVFGDGEFFGDGKQRPTFQQRSPALSGLRAIATEPVVIERDVVSWLLVGNFVLQSCCLIRRDAAIAAGLWDETLTMVEDRDFTWRVGVAGPLVMVPRVLAFKRIHPNNLTHPRNALRLAEQGLRALTKARARGGFLPQDHAMARLCLARTEADLLYHASRQGVGRYLEAARQVWAAGGRRAWMPHHLLRAVAFSLRRMIRPT